MGGWWVAKGQGRHKRVETECGESKAKPSWRTDAIHPLSSEFDERIVFGGEAERMAPPDHAVVR